MNYSVLYATLHYNKDDHFEGVRLICSRFLILSARAKHAMHCLKSKFQLYIYRFGNSKVEISRH